MISRALLYCLYFLCATAACAQGTKPLTCSGKVIAVPASANTLQKITEHLTKDPIVREYAHLYITDQFVTITYVPLTDSALHVIAQTKEEVATACASFSLFDYLKGYDFDALMDAAIDNAKAGKTPMTDLYWAQHFPYKPDNRDDTNIDGTKAMVLYYSSLRLSVTFIDGALRLYTRN